jgi:sialic acid synthase SpsE
MDGASLRIGPHTIGADHEPFVMAEAGVHHYNSVELAKEYLRQARVAGVHAVKFQTYDARRLTTNWAPAYWDEGAGRTQYEVFAERSLLSEGDYRQLFDFAAELGLLLLSTPFDPDAVRMLDDLGMPAFKIASADITDLPMLRVVAATGKPIVLSTGASTMDEIHRTVDALRSSGCALALLHCTLTYPTAVADANLRRITVLREEFSDLVIGYSDHTQPQDSELACPLAVALGARIIEKHYTLNRALPEDDHYHAVDQAGLCRLVKNCRDAWRQTWSYAEMAESESAARTYARRSIVAARDLPAEHVIAADDVDAKRPGTGISPLEIDAVVGRRTIRPFAADELIAFDGLDEQ